MRCNCCNRNLSDYEATRRHRETREFLDLCTRCVKVINETTHLAYTDRPELLGCTDVEDDYEEHDERLTEPLDEQPTDVLL